MINKLPLTQNSKLKTQNSPGIALVSILICLMILLISVPAIVNWIFEDTRQSVKIQKSTLAYNLAEGAIDRGMWKLKSSTSSWADAINNVVISNYNFDKTFDDLAGGYYRVKFASGPSTNQVTIYGEGKDLDSKEIRSIECVVENTIINSSLLSEGTLYLKNHLGIINWGPIIAHENLDMTDSQSASRYFPRKFSKQVVDGHGGYPRDENGLDPPNTDNVEWWSDYDVPDLPLLQFNTMRSSAEANGTLNVYRYWDSKVGSWVTGAAASPYFEDSDSYTNSQNDLIWYWDGNVEFTDTIGIKGNVIIRGNMTVSGTSVLNYTGSVPPNAWKEYQKQDTALASEYPADNGLGAVNSTFNFGSESWNAGAIYGVSDVPGASDTDIGFKGFVYVGGNLNFSSHVDINGAAWVVGTVDRTQGTGKIYVYYDNNLKNIPVSNISLAIISWEEELPDPQAWVNPS
ncbi:MAG: hypothetical protein HY547_01420 [Elusimicrobia bacterium]|nr:hypothetical protein [Elusimicrobiota bacterium]